MARTVIHSVTLFDGHDTHANATVVFDSDGGKITSVSTDSNDAGGHTPSEGTIINGKGHTLLPGLIESHMHYHTLHLPEGANTSIILTTPLKAGVTTVCDMHSDLKSVRSGWQAIADEVTRAKRSGGPVTMSDLKSSLYGATIKGGWPKPIVLGDHPTEETIAMVNEWPNLTTTTAADFVENHKANGASYIKLMQENCRSLAMPTNSIPVASLELQTAVVKAAHDNGLPAVGHALSLDMTEIILKSGADGLTHTFMDQPPPQSIIDLYKQTGAFVIPTLCVLASLTAELQDWRDRYAELAYDEGVIDELGRQIMKGFLGIKDVSARLDYAFETIRKLKAEGVDIVAGTDAVAGLKGTAIGPSLWMEMELYVEKCGMTVVEALNSATALPAKRFGFSDRGEVVEGKRADLILVKGNATERLQTLWEGEGIIAVWKQGLKAA